MKMHIFPLNEFIPSNSFQQLFKFNDKNNLGIEINGKLYKVNILPSPSFRNTIPISKKIEIYRQVLI